MAEGTAPDPKLLIVDDELTNVQLLERVLRQAGYTNLRSTTDSRQVVALFEEFQPDLILLDLRMPHRSGFEVMEDLQPLIPKESFVPILVLTADARGETLRQALLAGASDVLTKPFDIQEVLLRIKNLLHSRTLHLSLQHQNRVLEDRVSERTRQLLQMEKLSAMGQLLAGVAHELNNPLAVVLGQAQLLQGDSAGRPVATRAEKIIKAADRCVRIVRNFLALARERPPERTSVDLHTVAREAVELLGYELRTDSVDVQYDLAEPAPLLWADPHQLHQVLVNLVANAHHAMRQVPGPRRLTVETRVLSSPPALELRIADTGPGIPLEIQGRIFDPFFTTKPPGQGTGLGLSLSFGIIADHGGTIRVESAPGQGATFVVTLPVREVALESAPARQEPTPVRIQPKRILVVEDEADVAEVLADVLHADGHEVETTVNGAEALELLDRRAYDVVLSDTKMPVMDGLGLFVELERRHPELRGRIGFVTGDVLNAEKRAFLEGTGAPVLGKPFDVAEVRQVVQRLLQP